MNILEKATIECTDVVELFGDYLDNDLNPTLKERVAEHIAECEKCQDFEKSYRFVIKAAAELKPGAIEMSLAAKNRLRQALNERLGLSIPMIL